LRFRSPWPWLLGGGCLLVVLLGILLPRREHAPASQANPANVASRSAAALARAARPHRFSSSEPAPNAQEIVAGKVSRFAHDRLGVVRAMAKRYKIEVPPDVERFFAAAEAGRWEELKELFGSLKKLRESSEGAEALKTLFPAIMETYGIAQVAHDWPAQKLLDYGQAVLDSLRPGMVYVGGTDAGRFIPTLLNETSDGEQHVVLTQNALADASYLDYLRFLYGDRMTLPTPEDSQRAFQDYTSDAQQRLAHDQQFPDEPKQVRPGEDISATGNGAQVSGQVAVMAINEKLFQIIMDKNPDLSFGLEESFPFKSTYPSAVPLGPIMELGVQDAQKTFTADAAAQTVDYWQATTQSLLADSQTPEDSKALNAYTKMACSQAALLADHNFTAEAEETYRLAIDLGPSNPEAVFRYVNLLIGQGRIAEAIPVAETAANAAPDNSQFGDLLQNLKRVAGRH
jgi:tetratricopeptide (TPR) repeat protein